MARTKVTLNSGGVRAMLSSEETRAMLTEHAERVLAAAKESAPIDTGAYAESLHIEQMTGRDRAKVAVVAGVSYGLPVAVRTGHLARALDA